MGADRQTSARGTVYKSVFSSRFFVSRSTINAKLQNKRKEEEEEEEEESMQVDPGSGFIICTGGAKGTDQLAEELALQFGLKVEVFIPPRHTRSQTISPLHPRVLTLANPHLEVAAEKLGKRVPTDFHILHFIQRTFEIARRADTVYAFGILEDDCKRVQGGTGWTVQLALDLGKKVFVYHIESEAWFHSVYTSKVVQGCLETGVPFVTLSDRDKPTLNQNSAVVGTRVLDEKTRQEIRDLFQRTVATPPQPKLVWKER